MRLMSLFEMEMWAFEEKFDRRNRLCLMMLTWLVRVASSRRPELIFSRRAFSSWVLFSSSALLLSMRNCRIF